MRCAMFLSRPADSSLIEVFEDAPSEKPESQLVLVGLSTEEWSLDLVSVRLKLAVRVWFHGSLTRTGDDVLETHLPGE